jgi:hypothetical protein
MPLIYGGTDLKINTHTRYRLYFLQGLLLIAINPYSDHNGVAFHMPYKLLL